MQKKKNKLSFFEIIMLVLFLLTLFTGRNVISKLKWEIIILYFIIRFMLYFPPYSSHCNRLIFLQKQDEAWLKTLLPIRII